MPRLTGIDAGAAASDALEPPTLTGLRILVVDDEPDSLEIAAEALANTGATIVLADSGTKALEHWDKAPFDVVFCDLAMPGMDGYEVLRQIRSANANGAATIAIALTALASDSDRKAIVAAGFDHHIVKPFSFPDLIRAVSRAA